MAKSKSKGKRKGRKMSPAQKKAFLAKMRRGRVAAERSRSGAAATAAVSRVKGNPGKKKSKAIGTGNRPGGKAVFSGMTFSEIWDALDRYAATLKGAARARFGEAAGHGATIVRRGKDGVVRCHGIDEKKFAARTKSNPPLTKKQVRKMTAKQKRAFGGAVRAGAGARKRKPGKAAIKDGAGSARSFALATKELLKRLPKSKQVPAKKSSAKARKSAREFRGTPRNAGSSKVTAHDVRGKLVELGRLVSVRYRAVRPGQNARFFQHEAAGKIAVMVPASGYEQVAKPAGLPGRRPRSVPKSIGPIRDGVNGGRMDRCVVRLPNGQTLTIKYGANDKSGSPAGSITPDMPYLVASAGGGSVRVVHTERGYAANKPFARVHFLATGRGAGRKGRVFDSAGHHW